MTYEELLAIGYDEATARALAETSGGTKGSTLPFPELKLNYDTKDILIDSGVKKGEFIAGWVIDNKNLKVTEEGEVLKQPLEFFIVSSVYQQSHFDTKTGSTDIITDIFTDPFMAKKMIDKKSGKTIGQLKDEGKQIKFNNILLLMVKKGKEWKPYIHYLHGVNYMNFWKQCEDLDIDDNNRVMKTLFKVKSKKVPTNFNPAWIFEIIEARERSIKEISESVTPVSEAIKEFKAWIQASNEGGAVAPEEADGSSSPSSASTKPATETDDDVEVNFSE